MMDFKNHGIVRLGGLISLLWIMFWGRQPFSHSAPFQASLKQLFKVEDTLKPQKLPGISLKSLSPYVQKKKDEKRYQDAITRIAGLYQLDPALIKAIIRVESDFDPRAVSQRGACGLMQLMPNTAKAMGVSDSFDPEQNIDGGSKYFRQLMDRFNGDVELALAAYNAGSRYVLKYNGIPPFKVTKVYVKKVLKYQRHYQQGDPTV
jgi:soluble lytic murein transglycosylase-like protein